LFFPVKPRRPEAPRRAKPPDRTEGVYDSLLGIFYGIKEPLHPGFLTGRGIFLNNALSRGGIDLFDHVLEGRFGLSHFFFLGQKDKFFDAGPYRALRRLVPKPAAFALPMSFFRGTALTCQKITLHGVNPGSPGDLPESIQSYYLKSDGRRSCRLHFSHSATFFTLPFSKRVFILTSPPQEQKNFCVALDVREFLLD
jgi:hypothetical protein